MRTITCGIVDDEPLAVSLIEQFIARTPELEHRISFTDSIEAIKYLKANPVDLLFLDIQMPDMNGMELAKMLPESTKIVFTTAFRDYALESYDVEALDFLLKPLRFDKFLRAVEKAKKWYEVNDRNMADAIPESIASPTEIYLRCEGGLHRVQLDEIEYVEGLKDYVKFRMSGRNNSIITHLTMKSVEEFLPSDQFMRISRSHIISLNHISSVDRNLCVYIGDTMIKVTELYRDAFQKFLNNRIAGKS